MVRFLTFFILCFSIIFAGWYFLIYRPKNTIPNKIVEAKIILSKQKNHLTQNSLFLSDLARLNPLSEKYESSKNSIYASLGTNLNQAESEIRPLPEINGVAISTTVSQYQEVKRAHNNSLEEYKNLLIEAQSQLDRMKAEDEKTDILFSYSPTSDLASLDFTEKNSPELIKRSENAIKGLEAFSQKSSIEVKPFTDRLKRFVANLKSGHYDRARKELPALQSSYDQIKINVFNAKLESFKSKSYIELVANSQLLVSKFSSLTTKLDSLAIN